MKRYASHFLFFPDYGYLKRYAIEIRGAHVVRVFPLEEEVESVEWLPGVIALLDNEEAEQSIFDTCETRLEAVPSGVNEKLSSYCPVLFFPFDFTTMRPGAGTLRRPLR